MVNKHKQEAAEIKDALKLLADKRVQQSTQHFFKDGVQSHGVKIPTVRLIAKDTIRKLKGWSKEETLSLCELLWQSGYVEEATIATALYYVHKKHFTLDDFEIFERWINTYVNNWASCDDLCNHTVGALLEMYPALLSRLTPWTQSNNRWMRRAAAVSLILPARKGAFSDTVLSIATVLLHDKDDLVQKGYGWALKEISRDHPHKVFKFVMQHKATMPRTALRYAIEKLPEDLRAKAMEK
jgi:3-methyladenine DNA glycosylase AlkD